MNEFFRLIGIAFVLVICGFLLRDLGWRGAPVLAAVGALLLLSSLPEALTAAISPLGDLASASGASALFSSALKVLGVGYLSGMCADVSRDLGEQTIARAVQVAGRVEIFTIIAPTVLLLLREVTALL